MHAGVPSLPGAPDWGLPRLLRVHSGDPDRQMTWAKATDHVSGGGLSRRDANRYVFPK